MGGVSDVVGELASWGGAVIMVQQGQVLRMKSNGAEGRELWAYRYRVGGRGSRRVQRGGFASEVDAGEALERALERLRRANGTASTLTLAELVNESCSNTTRSLRRSRSCAGYSPRRYASSVINV